MDLRVACQGIYNIKNKEVMYTEVLVRRYKGITGADNIVKYEHEHGCCCELDEDIIEYTMRILTAKTSAGHSYGFNLCDKTLEKAEEAEKIIRIIKAYRGEHRIFIEITEDTDFNNKNVINNINTLVNNGVTIILDDFGKSNSNIEALAGIKFGIVKIDKDYIQRAMEAKRQLRILIGVIGLLDNLQITTVVEGIETLEHLSLADAMGVKAVQGYYMEMPKTIEDSEGETKC